MLFLQDTPKNIYAPKFVRSTREMDRGRYGPHHGWENNSVIAAFPLLTTKDAEDNRSIGHVIGFRVMRVML
jgi:hypothetical protein